MNDEQYNSLMAWLQEINRLLLEVLMAVDNRLAAIEKELGIQ